MPADAAPPVNRLGHEKSPYLLQHAGNPVEWYPWGEEAFAKARRENKMIFLSIGYSTCHWCHVMAHESFEDKATAAIMNREFVNIKVDREERPDVDRVYMTFVQATTGGGGWPMSVWLTPDLKPIVGGTYFPPDDRYGHPAFGKVLERIADAWKQNREKLVEQGSKIMDALREAQTAQTTAAGEVAPELLDAAYEQFDRAFDPKEGGFGTGGPKFPRPVTLNFLLRYCARNAAGCHPERSKAESKDPAKTPSVSPRDSSTSLGMTSAERDAEGALQMDLFTLRKMAAGGIHDHIGGGFHRYSVDRYWHVPHFEKMLYDQAQLVVAYLDAFQITQDRQYADVARDILDYVSRDMTAKEGPFYSAEDADSSAPVAAPKAFGVASNPKVSDVHPPPPDYGVTSTAPLRKKEGAFYVWTEKEIDDALGADAIVFEFHYGVQPHGNAPEGSDPQDEFRGKNILIERHTVAETARHFRNTGLKPVRPTGVSPVDQAAEEAIHELLKRCREKLLAIRKQRPRPHLDDKIIAAWNGLTITGYARAAAVLDEPRYLEVAIRAAKFIRSQLWDGRTLFRSYREGRGDVEGFADDYAFVIQGLIDLYEASFDVEWLKWAVELQETQDRLFFDEKSGGYFTTSGKDSSVLLRMKDDNDSAEPAASSVAVLNLLRLAQIRNDKQMEERARKTISAFGATLSHFASAMPQMLVALAFSLNVPQQIVIAGDPNAPDTKALLREVHRHFLPEKILLLADGSEGQKYLGERNDALRAMAPIDGKPAAYVCENFTCKQPVTDPKTLATLLSH